jgi:D-3-phosphoglycerate dehydrogenase / 2-oxoglutarate reductase
MKVNLEKKQYPIKTTSTNFEKNLLCTAPMHFLPEICEQLEKRFNVTYAFRAKKNDLLDLLDKTDMWIVDPGANYKIDSKLLSVAKKLEIIVSPSTGSDHIDLVYCKNNKIYFDCLKGKEDIISNIHASAEFSFALLLAMVRHMIPSTYASESGHWREIEDKFRGIELAESSIGLIGYGRIGKKMARYAQAFGAKVYVYDPYVEVSTTSEIVQKSKLEQLLEISDIVCLHVHLDETTLNMFDENEFSKMKKGSYFLNTSRGGIANEDALLKSLDSGHLKGAAVDVISGEQSDDFYNHKVISYARDHSNLIVSPHIAGLTYHSQGKAAQFAVDVIVNFLESK